MVFCSSLSCVDLEITSAISDGFGTFTADCNTLQSCVDVTINILDAFGENLLTCGGTRD